MTTKFQAGVLVGMRVFDALTVIAEARAAGVMTNEQIMERLDAVESKALKLMEEEPNPHRDSVAE